MSLKSLHDVPAPAKLNLFLHVVGRRDDGYHLLQSAFVLIDWCDVLHFERRSDGVLQRHDLGPDLPPDDLCLRAARALQAATGTAFGAHIHIHKHVPSGAGLGGGSSDAAATLLALNRLWGLHLPRARLAEIGLQIGADVPFFIGGTHAFVQGIGERLMPLSMPRQAYAVIKPTPAIPTAAIFQHPLLQRATAILAGFPEGAGLHDMPAEWLAGFGNNDLQAAAQAVCPEVAQAAAWLEARYGNSRMSGSGSAVFARLGPEGADRFDGKPAPPAAAILAEELPPGWVGRLCHSLDQHPLWGWAG